MVTLEELKISIEEERKKVKKAQEKEALRIKESQLKQELFKLKHSKAIAASGKGARLLKRAGMGLLKVSKTVAPVLAKQARLIRDQQLRDDAIERKISKKLKPKGRKKKSKTKKSKSRSRKISKTLRLEF